MTGFRVGGPWTRHGHPIDGVTVAGPGRPAVARCGGPAMCSQCADDAARLTEQHTADFVEMAEVLAEPWQQRIDELTAERDRLAAALAAADGRDTTVPGPVVPTPPAEVPQMADVLATHRITLHQWAEDEGEARCRCGAVFAVYAYAYRHQAERLAPLVGRMVAERVRAARDEALREAERRLLTEPDPVRFAARIVAELREATR